jgi:hypothetical protein
MIRIQLLLIFACFSSLSYSQTETERLKVFIDCQSCDQNFIRQELDYLTYVRDRLTSEVHIQVVNQDTGSGGELFTFFFYGIGDFAAEDDTLTLVADVNNTSDEVRRKQVKTIQLGLIKYMLKKGYLDQITIGFDTPDSSAVEQEKDPWNNWVFTVEAMGWFNGEAQYKSMNLNGGFNVNRTTEEWRISSGVWLNYQKGVFYLEEDTVYSNRESLWADIEIVKSLTDHWSLGFNVDHYSSIYDNFKIATAASPAIEYNIFKYSESTKHQIRISYRAGAKYNEYNEETIYNKNSEALLYERLGVEAQFQQKWGSVYASVNGSHYFHNFDINRVDFRLRLNLRLFKGFSWNMSGNLSLIHDQISLPLGDASEEDVLLSQRQLQTGFRYNANMGITYTFGSIYNSVVNPRFGG